VASDYLSIMKLSTFREHPIIQSLLWEQKIKSDSLHDSHNVKIISPTETAHYYPVDKSYDPFNDELVQIHIR